MSSNKKEPRNNFKGKRDQKYLETKRSATTLQMPQVKNHSRKLRLESSTDSRLPVFNKPRKYHNCVDPNPINNTPFKKPQSVLKRKSISLIELTSNTPKTRIWTPKKWESKESADESKTKPVTRIEDELLPMDSKESELANKVCKMFILNAWRHRRAQNSSIQNKMTKMVNEIDNLNIQVVVLRNLLESEKLRVAVSMSDAAHLKLRLEDELKENSCLRSEINSLKNEKNAWKTEEEKMVSKIQNLTEELTLTGEQNKYLRRECDDFDKAITEAKERENDLHKRLNEAIMHIKEKDKNLAEILKKSADLHTQTTEMKRKTKNLLKENENKERKINECINKINSMDVELNNSKNICKVQNENILSLKRDLGVVENKFKIQTMEADNMKNTIEQYEYKREQFKQIRNRIIFEVVKIFPNLFLPYYQHL